MMASELLAVESVRPQFAVALVLGTLFAVGTFLLLRRDIVRVIWGLAVISQATNVYLIAMGGLSGRAPVLGGHGAGSNVTDPVVQALVLTAIVISFATTTLALVLTYRAYQENGTIDTAVLGGRQ